MSDFLKVSLDLLNGFGMTVTIFAATLIFALPLGLLIAFASMSGLKPLKALTRTFVWIIRGTPLMLQILVVYYGPALLWNWGFLDRLSAVIVAFVLNYACYFAEIYRGGIESIPRGQYEAGQVLGLTRTSIFFRIVLLQVIKRIVAPLSNEVITLVKDTSLARIIVVAEILKVAYDYTAKGLVWPLFYTGAYYLLFVGALTLLFGFIEKKLGYFKV